MRVFAPAKINLFLHITGKRPDGYHELQSVMAFAGIGDFVDVAKAADFALEVQGPFAATLSAGENTIRRAATLLAEKHGIAPRARIMLTKNLPVAAGLGGGSSDAAAALKGLAQLWGLTETQEGLAALALAIGADVPVCLAARPAFAEGVGEKLSPVALPAFPAVLVNPRVATPTARVFARFSGPFAATVEKKSAYTLDDLAALDNGLTQAAIAVTPEIAPVLAALAETPGCRLARLSGSGATCFGIYPDEKAASSAAALLKKAHPAWWIVPTQIN